MKEEDTIPEIQKTVSKTTPVKEWLVDYVGNVCKPDNDEVTIEMIIEVLAKEFPEFLLPIAEENFIRGYKQAFVDIGSADATTSLPTPKG